MKNKTLVAVSAVLALTAHLTQADPLGTAFTYQGRLTDGGNPANGSYDFKFTLRNAGPGPVAGPVTNAAVAVSNGLFTTTLDFGAGVFNGDARWLEIGARTNGGATDFTTLAPGQPLTPSPYALYAPSAGTLVGNPVVTGTTLFSPASGAPFLVSNTNKVANLNADLLDGLDASAFWKTAGNGGTTPGVNFLGTTDFQPLELRVNNLRALRLEPPAAGAPNVIGGSSGNSIAAWSSVIAGGDGNYIGADSAFSAVGGGLSNSIANTASNSVVAGGAWNDIGPNAKESFIGGGWNNNVADNSLHSVIAGGIWNDIGTNASNSVIGGGEDNNIATSAYRSAIAGGYLNDIGTSAYNSVISGGEDNNIAASAYHSTIAGGYLNDIGTSAYDSGIAGGRDNNIAAFANRSVIAGGYLNDIGASAYSSAVGGGRDNNIGTNSPYGTIAGGRENNIRTNCPNSTVGGGYNNIICTSNSVIAGGVANFIGTNAPASAIGGGEGNYSARDAAWSTIGGGYLNYVGTNATRSAIGGGGGNVIGANSSFATIPGGQQAMATNYAQMAYSSGQFQNAGDSQYSLYVLRGTTTWENTTPQSLFLDGSVLEINLATNKSCSFTARIVGRDSVGNTCAFNVRGGARNVNGPVTVSAPLNEILMDDFGGSLVNITSSGNNRLSVQVSCPLATGTVRWTATVETAEVAF